MSVRHIALAGIAALMLSACATRRTPVQVVESPACAPCAACPACADPAANGGARPLPEAAGPNTPAPANGGAGSPAVPLPSPNVGPKPLVESSWRELPGWGSDDLSGALTALMESCAVMKQAPWPALCAEAAKLSSAPREAQQRFFETRFVPMQVVNADATREGLVTGYYEPLVKGSRKRSKLYAAPLYGPPADLVSVDLTDVLPELKGQRMRGRYDGQKLVPYWTREEITKGGKLGAQEPLFWLADPIDLFFLQVQGSGRIDLDDGTRVRVGYADTNGHPYKSIGRWLVDKGELKVEQASQDGIKAWARANPGRVDEMLNANPSYVFFREMPVKPGAKDAGPLGSQGVPLTAGRSIAVDMRAIPLGAPVWLATTLPNSAKPLQRLVMAQDTGSAIKGAVRADFYWGFGAEAGAQAGRMRQSGRLWVLQPR